MIKRRQVYRALLGVASLLLLGAGPAHAVDIDPDNTHVTGFSSNTQFTYGGNTLACSEATAEGWTGLDSPTVELDVVTFGGTCTSSPLPTNITVTTSASGSTPWFLHAETADGTGGGTGSVEIPTGGSATIVVRDPVFNTLICTLTVGPQRIDATFDAGDDDGELEINDSSVATTRSGSSLCGPASGNATFTGEYDTSPNTLAINP